MSVKLNCLFHVSRPKTTSHLGYSFRFLKLLLIQLSHKIVCHQENQKATCWGHLLGLASVTRKWQHIFWIQLLICQTSLLSGMFYVPTLWQLFLFKQTLYRTAHFRQLDFLKKLHQCSHGFWMITLLCEEFLQSWLGTKNAVCWAQFMSANKLETGSFSYEKEHIKVKII